MKLEDILRWIIYLGAGLLALTPLIVVGDMYFPYITGKAFYFRAITAVIFGAWTVLAIFYKKYRPRFSPVAAALGALIVVAFVASLLGVNTYDSIWSNLERMMGWITLVHVGAAFLAIAHTLSERHWRRLFGFSFGVSLVAAIVSFSEVGSVARVDATLGNPIYLAVYAMFHAILAGFFIVKSAADRQRKNLSIWGDWRLYALSITVIFNLAALYFTQTRGAILGLAVGGVVTALLVAIFEKKHRWLRWGTAGLVALGVLAVGLLVGFRESNFVQNQPVLNRFANISVEDGTVGARLDIWALGLEGYQQSAGTALIGWGPDNFNYVFNTYYNPELFDEETWFDRAHNVAIEWLVAAGPLGLLSYLGIFAAAIYLIWRDPRVEDTENFSVPEKAILTGLTVAYLVQNLSVFDHLVSYLLLLFLLGWLHARSSQKLGWFTERPEISESGKLWASTGAVVVVAGLGVWVNYPGYMQATTLIDALRQGSTAARLAEGDRLAAARDYREQAIPEFSAAISYGAMGTQEARERLAAAAEDVAAEHGATSSIATEYFAAASEQYQLQFSQEPEDLRHRVFYGELLSTYGQHEAAIEQFARASEMGGGQKQKILFQLAREQSAVGRQDAALETYRRAYELDRSFAQPAQRYAQALNEAGRTEEAAEILSNHTAGQPATASSADGAISLGELIEAGEYEQVIDLLEQQISENGDNPQLYASLAAVQVRAGYEEEAIATLQEAAAEFPQLEEQANQMIERIRTSNPTRP